MIIEKDYLDFLTCLNRNGVLYLVIGGYAMSAHDRPRYTGDIDIWIKREQQNAERIQKAIADFGFGSLGITKDDFLSAEQFVQLGHEPVRIDITPDISGVNFDEAYDSRKELNISGIDVPFIGIDELIRNKLASGRDQDLVDAKNLQRNIKSKRKK